MANFFTTNTKSNGNTDEKLLTITMHNLVDNYINNTKYKKDELYYQIEKIYLENSSVKAIVEDYISVYTCAYKYINDDHARQAITFIDKINKQFEESTSIAEDYSSLLLNISFECHASLRKECYELISAINNKYLSNFIEDNKKEIESLIESDIAYNKLFLKAKTLEMKLQDNNSIETIECYIEHLLKLIPYCDFKEACKIKKRLKTYASFVGNNEFVIFKLMEANSALMPYVEDNETRILFAELKEQFKQISSEKAAEIYAKGLDDLVCRQNDLLEDVFKEIKNLYLLYSDNIYIQEIMGVGLTCIEYIQNETDRKSTEEKLLALAKKHQDNIELQEVVKDAYQPFGAFWNKSNDSVTHKYTTEKNISESITSTDCFAVLDTETNWQNVVMSIGIVIADKKSYCPIKMLYYIITPEYLSKGRYSNVLNVRGGHIGEICSRNKAIENIYNIFNDYGVKSIYAYNAAFDQRHLPELEQYSWYDIMLLAANINSNRFISKDSECYKNGRLKKGYGAETIIKIISGNNNYTELHNALFDAIDELKIMQYLRYDLDSYKKNNEIQENIDCIQRIGVDENLYETGDRIYNTTFGHGIIISISSMEKNKYQATVIFANIGIKNICLPNPSSNNKIL